MLLRPVPSQSTQALAVGLAAAAIAGCGADLDLWTGAHLDYSSSPSLTACQGTHQYVDDFVPFLSDELGIDTNKRLEYQWLDDADFGDAPCRESIGGCARSNTAYARKPSTLHEVVHTVTWAAGMNGHLFFTEGIAVAYDPWLGDGIGTRYALPGGPGQPLADPRLELDASTDELDYGLAGSFVTFLLARHGPEKFVSFSRILGANSTVEAIRSTFKTVYELDFDGEAELFMVGAPCTDSLFPVRVYDCAAPEVDWSDDSWSFSAGMDCSHDPVIGATGADSASPLIRSVSLQVPTTGQYTLTVEGDSEVIVQAGPCFGCPWVAGDIGARGGTEITGELNAGPHYVRIQTPDDDSPDVRVVLRPVP
jgi:hypothetical protein